MLASTYYLRSAPDEALTREKTLLARTRGGAFAERIEHRKGRIAPGLAADLAVPLRGILRVPWQDLPATRSILTIRDGEVVHEEIDVTRRDGVQMTEFRYPLIS